MKKLALSLAVLFAVGLVSCGGNDKKACEDSAACEEQPAVVEEGAAVVEEVTPDSVAVAADSVAVETPAAE